MATAFTYTTLAEALAGHLEEDDFDGNVDTLIRLGEDDLLKALDLEIFKATDPVSFVNGVATVTKPTGYLKADNFYYTSAGARAFLEERTVDYLIDYWPAAATVTNTPKFYAELNETQLLVAGTPGAGIAGANGTMRHLKRPASIVDTPTTWLGTNVGDLLMHACMVAAEKFGMNDERIQMWRGEYAKLLQGALIQFANLRSRSYFVGEK